MLRIPAFHPCDFSGNSHLRVSRMSWFIPGFIPMNSIASPEIPWFPTGAPHPSVRSSPGQRYSDWEESQQETLATFGNGELTPRGLQLSWSIFGINRLSIGVPDFDSHTHAETIDWFEGNLQASSVYDVYVLAKTHGTWTWGNFGKTLRCATWCRCCI